MKSSIALIGFMGTGKSAVGQALAKKLRMEFIELDSLIEKRAGKSVTEIFQEEGEVAFREMEIDAIKDIADRKNIVIATGGGAVLNLINIERLKKESVMVLLTASPAEIIKRISQEGGRPLLNGANKAADIRELLRFRKPFYERAAEITIDTSGLDVDIVVKEIIARLKESQLFNFQGKP